MGEREISFDRLFGRRGSPGRSPVGRASGGPRQGSFWKISVRMGSVADTSQSTSFFG
jgi:hypothetical protein